MAKEEVTLAVHNLLLVKEELQGLRPAEAKVAEHMLYQKYGLIQPELTREEREYLYEIHE